jgi:hypothetical protein
VVDGSVGRHFGEEENGEGSTDGATMRVACSLGNRDLTHAVARVGVIDEWHVVIRKLLTAFDLRRFFRGLLKKIA